MNLTEIDRWCDRFEQRLRGGDRLTVEEFLASESLSAEVELVRELRKVADELAAEAPGNVDASSSTSPRVGRDSPPNDCRARRRTRRSRIGRCASLVRTA
jgi:hypothetical protein